MIQRAMWILAALAAPALAAASGAGQVYTQSNAAAGNQVLAFERGADGALAPAGAVATGGQGTGASLGSQGALAVSRNGRWLLAVNAGSDTVSLFEATAAGLELRDIAPSGGRYPISVAISGRRVAVLNAGGSAGGVDSVSVLALEPDGRLSPVAGGARPLSAPSTGPAQVAFAAGGEVVAVTEKATSRISTYTFGEGGALEGPFVHASAGATPFGFAVSHEDRLVVSEAGASTVSSYAVEDDGTLSVVTAALPDLQGAACWVAATPDGRHAYVANAATASITGLSIDSDGAIARLDADGVSARTGPGNPLDTAVSRDGRYLYTLTRTVGTIVGYEIGADGSLAPIGAFAGVPATASGLAAR